MITTLTMENFLPFRDRVELPLAGQGLVLVRGDNRISQAADSNGAGKSSIGHAVCWGLFGIDMKGRRADDIACRFTEGMCIVRLDMEDALGKWGVQRTRRPAGLTVYGVDGVEQGTDMSIVQQKIEQRLGFGMRTFKNAVVFGQGAFERYASADQADQMRMLDEIQGIDFRDAGGRAREWRDGLVAESAKADGGLRSLVDKIDAASRHIESMEALRDTFESRRRVEIQRLDARRPELQRRISDATAAMSNLESDRRMASELKSYESAISTAQDAFDVADDRQGKESEALNDLVAERDDIQERLRALMEEDACPSCRRPVKSSKAAIKALFGPDIKSLTERIKAADNAAERTKAAVKTASIRLADAKDRAMKAFAGFVDAPDLSRAVAFLEARSGRVAEKKARDAGESARKDLETLDAEIERSRAEAWDGAMDLVRRAAERDERVVEQAALAVRRAKLADALLLAEYWVEAFGDRGIRSLLVDGVSVFVNSRLDYHLSELTCGEATVRMSAQTALKKGGARERISFSTEWAWGGTGADDGSGGQDQRKHLAVFAAIQDLAEARSARPFPLKIFDEPFDNLDARGQEMAISWVKKQAKERGTALLMTHNESLSALSEPDVIWTVVLDENGATVARVGVNDGAYK